MHISCPRCDKTINAKNYNLFQIWECPDCEWKFRGVHASQPIIKNFIFEFISPLYHGPHINDMADCPSCGETILLRWIFNDAPGRSFGPLRKKGYDGPYVCHSCRHLLPWDYPEQKPLIAKSYNKWVVETQQKEIKLKVKKESRQPTHTEEEKQRLSKLAAQLYKEKHNL
jgi:hypothetical protein